MKHGNLSYKMMYSIAFKFENFIAKENKNLFNRLFQNKYVFNKDVIDEMRYLYLNTDYSIDIVCLPKNKDYILHNCLDLPFNRIIEETKLSAIGSRILIGDISYYVDNDKKD